MRKPEWNLGRSFGRVDRGPVGYADGRALHDLKVAVPYWNLEPLVRVATIP